MTSGKLTYQTTPPVRAVDLAQPRRIHLIGIGGAGMSAIATVLSALGHIVVGTDQRESAAVERLRGLGIGVTIGHGADTLGDAEIVSRSTAIPNQNPEVMAAVASNLPVYRRDELLAAITGLRYSISVGGTHGKTTTSSMLTVIMRAAGLAPSFIIGGKVQGIGVGAALDSGPHLVVEADESDGTFLRLVSRAALVTSVEPDHLDYYGSAEIFEQAFVEFLEAVDGPRVLSLDDDAAVRVSSVVPAMTYGTNPDAEYVLAGYQAHRDGCRFEILHRDSDETDGDQTWASVELAVPGLHNARNATAALLLASRLGVDQPTALSALSTFAGVARRYELRGEAGGVTFIDDYAHLPSEVSLTLEAAKAGDWNRVICVFQPHRFTRTEAIGPLFTDAFLDADRTFVTSIYSAGEQPIAGVSGAIVAEAFKSAHPAAPISYVPDRADLSSLLLAELQAGDLCLTLGAGDLTTLPDELMTELRR